MSEAATTVTVTVTTAVTTSVEVKPTLESLIRVIPFSVSIPAGIDFLDAATATATATATVQVPSNDNERFSSTSSTGSTVVGTITLMGSSIMIWMSWDFASTNNSKNNRNAPPQMGPLCIAAPAPSFQRQRQRQRQRGKSSSSPSSSQLIGSHSDEDQMLALQMSTRMTKLVEKPVLISSSLYSMAEHTIEQQMGGMAISSSDGINNNQGGITAAPLVMRASALAERKVKSILLELKEGNKL